MSIAVLCTPTHTHTPTHPHLCCHIPCTAARLAKPLACRLLPLPGKLPGQPTGFDHPYMVNSAVMDLDT